MSFFIDITPVTNEAYADYLEESGYFPADDQNWLRDWDAVDDHHRSHDGNRTAAAAAAGAPAAAHQPSRSAALTNRPARSPVVVS